MKVTITIELDVSMNPAMNAANVKEIPAALQNLGSFIQGLHFYHLDKKCDSLFKPDPCPITQKAILDINDADLAVTDQLFNNYKIEGTTDDGNAFCFTHKEPGYQETFTVNGINPEDH